MDGIERQLEHIVDRDIMHRLIDDLEPGQVAILLTRPAGIVIDIAISGEADYVPLVGMLEAAKMLIYERSRTGDPGDECDCEEHEEEES